MVVKKIKNGESRKPKAWQIADLVDYIRYPHSRKPEEKIAYAGGRNFFADSHVGQKVEMISLARETSHSKMPVSHWVFSWQEGERPSNEQVEEVVDVFLERMGLEGHQTVYGLHHDTDNFHLHIAVNRMDEESGKVIQPHRGFDIQEAHKIVALIEHRQGWASEPKALFTVLENGELARNVRKRERKPKQPALDFENATGAKSAQRIAQERGHAIIENAQSWPELHEKLAAVGLRFEKKGSGAIVWAGNIAVKASSVDRAFSMKKLCARLGDFEEGNYPDTIEKTAPEPVSSVNREEWEAYQAEYTAGSATAPDTRKEVSDTLKAEIESLKIRQKQERESKLSRLAKYGLPVMNIARHCLWLQQRQEVRDLRQRLKRSGQAKGKLRFETWLRSHGMNDKAENWRHRTRLEEARHASPPPAQRENNLSGKDELRLFQRYAIAVNADRYRVTCIKMQPDGEKKTFILDKKDGPSRGFTPDELAVRIPEMLRLQARGENIYYTPLSEDRHHILIDDMSEVSLERFQRRGFKPAVILRSSPGNFQCILTVPKLGTEFDRDVGNRLTERLNREYGDKNLCGCIHPHRAPGFENRKPKHRKEDGTYPQVRLVFAERRQCPKALELAKWIDYEYREAARKRLQARPFPSASLRPGDPSKAYYAHLENIRKHLIIEDYSRVDAMIALRMRANGHSKETVAETIRTCAPTIRENPKGRDWQRYAERTADYAFGMAGDQDMARNQRFWPLWRKVEGLGEVQQEQPTLRMS